MDKIILLSDCFEVTTDYLLKGIEMQSDSPEKTKPDARIFTTVGTALNFIGLVSAIMIWMEERTPVSVAVGFIVMAFGCMVGIIGQFVGENVISAQKWLIGVNIWLLLLMPASCIFNFVQGKLGGYWWTFSPIPQIGNSWVNYSLFWLFYIAGCLLADAIVFLHHKNEVKPKVV